MDHRRAPRTPRIARSGAARDREMPPAMPERATGPARSAAALDTASGVGAGGRSRTDTLSPELDFESSASTSSATPADHAAPPQQTMPSARPAAIGSARSWRPRRTLRPSARCSPHRRHPCRGTATDAPRATSIPVRPDGSGTAAPAAAGRSGWRRCSGGSSWEDSAIKYFCTVISMCYNLQGGGCAVWTTAWATPADGCLPSHPA
jgi:hypothetical protein